jgi:hypothetical protein
MVSIVRKFLNIAVLLIEVVVVVIYGATYKIELTCSLIYIKEVYETRLTFKGDAATGKNSELGT